MDFDAIDADGHVTESWEQIARHLDEPLLPQALAYIGEDHVVYASDVPHWDHGGLPKSIAELKGRPDVTDGQKQKVLADNARRLDRLP